MQKQSKVIETAVPDAALVSREKVLLSELTSELRRMWPMSEDGNAMIGQENALEEKTIMLKMRIAKNNSLPSLEISNRLRDFRSRAAKEYRVKHQNERNNSTRYQEEAHSKNILNPFQRLEKSFEPLTQEVNEKRFSATNIFFSKVLQSKTAPKSNSQSSCALKEADQNGFMQYSRDGKATLPNKVLIHAQGSLEPTNCILISKTEAMQTSQQIPLGTEGCFSRKVKEKIMAKLQAPKLMFLSEKSSLGKVNRKVKSDPPQADISETANNNTLSSEVQESMVRDERETENQASDDPGNTDVSAQTASGRQNSVLSRRQIVKSLSKKSLTTLMQAENDLDQAEKISFKLKDERLFWPEKPRAYAVMVKKFQNIVRKVITLKFRSEEVMQNLVQVNLIFFCQISYMGGK